MTKVYLIRHAEAEGNLYRRMHGWYNSAITVRGERQLSELAARFRGVRLDAVYSSDLNRAVKTAEAVAREAGLPVIATKRLREVCLGAWEDRPWGEATAFQPQQLLYFNNDPEKWSIEGGEPFERTQARMLSALTELAAAHDGGTIAAVSHGAAIRAALAAILHVPSAEISTIRHCDNTAVTELEIDGKTGEMRVLVMGDASHLSPENTRFWKEVWWKKDVDFDLSGLRFEPLKPEEDGELYALVRPGGFETACRRVREDENAVVWALYREEKIGLIELDEEKERESGAGWIDWYFMRPAWRAMRLSVQMLGHAVSVYRGQGREKLRLVPADDFAADYFKEFGFAGNGVLEKDIRV
ncbi:MAG: histidine phosphatase family protein [Oscillospiraceae bacterium]|nr:histidine phosphatase family protein [Oscillospiraceae bacterium]